MSSENCHNENVQNNFPWINKEFFEKILKKEFENFKSLSVLNYTLRSALKLGENYTSEMLRAKVYYAVESNNSENVTDANVHSEINFIIKAALLNEQFKMELDDMNLFQKEIIIYRDILPAVQKLLHSINDDSKFSAKCFATDDINQSYLVFEDLSVLGYRNIDRRPGLDNQHFKKMLSKLAKFHAATAVLESRELLPRTIFNKPNINENATTFKKLIMSSYQTLIEYTAITPGYEQINVKLNRIIDTIYSKICLLVTRDDSAFNTLLHGDLWANNMMFTYDSDGSLKDAIMIDYQVGYWGSIILDLSYSLFSSSHESLSERDWDYLLQHYHHELSDTLKKLNYPKCIPSLIDVHVEFLYRGGAYAALGCIVLGIRKLEDVDEDALGKFLHDTEEDRKFRLNMVNAPDMQKTLKFLLHFFDRKGFFD